MHDITVDDMVDFVWVNEKIKVTSTVDPVHDVLLPTKLLAHHPAGAEAFITRRLTAGEDGTDAETSLAAFENKHWPAARRDDPDFPQWPPDLADMDKPAYWGLGPGRCSYILA